MKIEEIYKYWVMVQRCEELLSLDKLTTEQDNEFVDLASKIEDRLDATAVGVLRKAKTWADMIRL